MRATALSVQSRACLSQARLGPGLGVDSVVPRCAARLAYEDAQRRGAASRSAILPCCLTPAAVCRVTDGRRSIAQARAEQRQPHAMYLLRLHFRHGDGVERDLKRALELFRSAWKAGSWLPRSRQACLINRRQAGFSIRAPVSLCCRSGGRGVDAGANAAQGHLQQSAMRRHRSNEKPSTKSARTMTLRCYGSAAWPGRAIPGQASSPSHAEWYWAVGPAAGSLGRYWHSPRKAEIPARR